MKEIVTITFLTVTLFAFSQNNNKVITKYFSIKERKIAVYTSADSTNFRLSKTESNLQFSELKQPLETQICVFVNPNNASYKDRSTFIIKFFPFLLKIGCDSMSSVTIKSEETFLK